MSYSNSGCRVTINLVLCIFVHYLNNISGKWFRVTMLSVLYLQWSISCVFMFGDWSQGEKYIIFCNIVLFTFKVRIARVTLFLSASYIINVTLWTRARIIHFIIIYTMRSLLFDRMSNGCLYFIIIIFLFPLNEISAHVYNMRIGPKRFRHRHPLPPLPPSPPSSQPFILFFNGNFIKNFYNNTMNNSGMRIVYTIRRRSSVSESFCNDSFRPKWVFPLICTAK